MDITWSVIVNFQSIKLVCFAVLQQVCSIVLCSIHHGFFACNGRIFFARTGIFVVESVLGRKDSTDDVRIVRLRTG